MFSKIDSWITDRLQWVYDYLWDRWGIYIGQFQQTVWVGVFGVDAATQRAGWFTVLCAIFILGIQEFRNSLQKKGLFAALNISSLQSREMPKIRWVINWIVIVSQVAASDWLWATIGSFLFVVYIQAFCIMIRDRDGSRFKSHKAGISGNAMRFLWVAGMAYVCIRQC